MQNTKRQSSSFNFTHAAVAFVLGAACGLLFNSVNQFLKQPFMAPPYAFEGKCTRIIDGDTIIVASKHDGNFTVNLVSVNVPDKGDKHFPKVMQFMTKTLLNRDVTVQPNRGVVPGEVDAWVYDGPQCFNCELVKAGYAQYAHGDLRDAPLKALQDEARKSKRGLWNDPTFKVQEQCCQ